MTYTINGSSLILSASPSDRARLRELRGPVGEYGETSRPYDEIEYDALEPLICNSDLNWIRPEEIGALTSAPILGIRDGDENGTCEPSVIAAWAFMPYQVRSFVDDLINTGKAVFTS